MSVAILKANYYSFAPFTVPQSKTVIIDMEAGGVVDMYVFLDERELSDFKNGQRPYQRAAVGITNFYNKINLSTLTPINAASALVPTPASAQTFLSLLTIRPPYPGSTWYLVIVNQPQNNKDIPIFYRVYNA